MDVKLLGTARGIRQMTKQNYLTTDKPNEYWYSTKRNAYNKRVDNTVWYGFTWSYSLVQIDSCTIRTRIVQRNDAQTEIYRGPDVMRS